MRADREYLVRLPWPPRALWPNEGAHWARKARAVKEYRRAAWALSQEMGCKNLAASRLTIEITFCPPDRRRRDEDNMIASIKSGLDGIADATGVDDANWNIGHRVDDPVTGGAVLVHVIPVDGWQQIGDVARKMVKGQIA